MTSPLVRVTVASCVVLCCLFQVSWFSFSGRHFYFMIFWELRPDLPGVPLHGLVGVDHRGRQRQAQYDGAQRRFPRGHEERPGHRLLGDDTNRSGLDGDSCRVLHLHHLSTHRPDRGQRGLWYRLRLRRPHSDFMPRFYRCFLSSSSPLTGVLLMFFLFWFDRHRSRW